MISEIKFVQRGEWGANGRPDHHGRAFFVSAPISPGPRPTIAESITLSAPVLPHDGAHAMNQATRREPRAAAVFGPNLALWAGSAQRATREPVGCLRVALNGGRGEAGWGADW